MKNFLKKKIVLIPLIIITLYLVTVIIYYFKLSSDTSAFCDKHYRKPDRVKSWADKDITPEDIDTILFEGAAEKGYSVKTETQLVDPLETDEPEQEVLRMITPDGGLEWLGYKDSVYRESNMKDNMNRGIKKYEENYKNCNTTQFFKAYIFTLGTLVYIEQEKTYLFEPSMIWFTPARYMSMA